MRKPVIVAYLLTAILLLMMAVIGFVNTYLLYLKYGWTYEVTTIITNVETVELINLMNNFTGVIFVIWMAILLFYAIILKYREDDLK